ncbi:MAG: sigma-54 dependent transcriptional regulator [Pseudomonadota bacterium]
MITYTVYVIDDEDVARNGITLALQKNYRVQGFETAEQGLDAMQHNQPDLVLLDIGLPGMTGIDALRNIKEHYPDMLVIMITAFEDIGTVVAAMKLGAYDYIVKPIHMDTLFVTIQNALGTIRLRKEVQALQKKYLEENIPCFIGESKSIQSVMEFVDLVARSSDTPVLICGETGTGKELIASAVHYKSPNFKGPFVTLNCAAIPKELVESELFGYEKGAFSGALERGKKGIVEEASGGTLFLDEVGDLSMEAQAKLLRFLEEGEYYRVGGTHRLRVKTRVVSATNKDLDQMIHKGLFRQDLYYRIAVIKVVIPCLKKRPEDILPIARHFLVTFSSKFGKAFTAISREAEKILMDYDWKGNIRELRNTIERAALTGTGPELSPLDIYLEQSQGTSPDPQEHLPGLPALSPRGLDLLALLASIEKRYIDEAVKLSQGNESEAARLLHLNYYTFRHRKKKTDVQR